MTPIRALIEGAPQASASGPAQTTVDDTTAAVVVAANAKRKGLIAQNTGVKAIYLGFDAAPSATIYHVALSPCTLADDGKGGAYFDDGFTGDVWAVSATGGSTMVLTEILTGGATALR